MSVIRVGTLLQIRNERSFLVEIAGQPHEVKTLAAISVLAVGDQVIVPISWDNKGVLHCSHLAQPGQIPLPSGR